MTKQQSFDPICFCTSIFFHFRHHAPFNTPFFRLCIHLSVADILCCIFITLFFKFPMFGIFPASFYRENWSAVPLVGMNYLGHAQAVGIIFIAVNRCDPLNVLKTFLFRFTAVYFPIRHKQNWWTPKVKSPPDQIKIRSSRSLQFFWFFNGLSQLFLFYLYSFPDLSSFSITVL